MINIYQELIPLSNKKYDKPISKDAKYTNPIIIPFVLDSTGSENIMETVLYVKNEAQDKYYKNIVISLMKESGTIDMPTSGELSFSQQNILFSLNSSLNKEVGLAFEYPQQQDGLIYLTNKYKSSYEIITNDPNIEVKFSYGYDEISYNDWYNKKSLLLIPYLGTQGMADTSYIPVRMRITWKTIATIATIRDYFLDVSYSFEGKVSV